MLTGSCSSTGLLLGDACNRGRTRQTAAFKWQWWMGQQRLPQKRCTLLGAPACLGSHPAFPPAQALDSHAGAGSSYQVPQLLAVATKVSATWDCSRQMQCLSSSVALSRLWVDLVPSGHKRKTTQVFCKLTLGKVEMKTSPAFDIANPLD